MMRITSIGIPLSIMYSISQVTIRKEFANLIPKGRLLKEDEWRHLGIQMSFGWEHYCEYKLSIICGFNCRPRTTVLLFRRPLGTDGRTGLVDPVRSKELKEKFRRDYGLE